MNVVEPRVSSAAKASDGRDPDDTKDSHADESACNVGLPATLLEDSHAHQDTAVEGCVENHEEEDDSPSDEMYGLQMGARAL